MRLRTEMKTKQKSVSFWLFIVSMVLLSGTYLFLNIRLNTLDKRLAEYRHETQRRKYVRAAKYWVDYEMATRQAGNGANR
jgi:membrane-associated PAP2 superfamily phosphatase